MFAAAGSKLYMGKARYRIALCAARLSIPVLRLTGHKATDFPGRVALKICPDFLKYIDRPRLVLGVTDTNSAVDRKSVV